MCMILWPLMDSLLKSNLHLMILKGTWHFPPKMKVLLTNVYLSQKRQFNLVYQTISCSLELRQNHYMIMCHIDLNRGLFDSHHTVQSYWKKSMNNLSYMGLCIYCMYMASGQRFNSHYWYMYIHWHHLK